jgi:hypothetical protein
MSWCGSLCDGVEDAARAVEEAVEDAVDTVVEAVEDAASAVTEFAEEAAEFAIETASGIGEFVAEVADRVWDWITETADSVWDWIKKTAGDIWEWTSQTTEAVWDWVKETASDAWDWIVNAASAIWDALVHVAEKIEEFWTETLAPFLLDALWVLTHLDEFILSLGVGLACLMTRQDDREYDLIEGMFRLDEDMLALRQVAFLPAKSSYVVFSDHHLFVRDDPKDAFRQLGNHDLYQAVLAVCYGAGFTLIENGDVEDLWMREESLGEAVREATFDILGFPFGDLLEADYEDYRIRSQAVKIFENNADVYQTIRTLFHNQGRYVRVVGNHDDVWRSQTYLEGLQLMYPGLPVYDYVFLGDYQPGVNAHGGHQPDVIIAHGHQVDGWNTYACRVAGEGITESGSFFPSMAAGTVKRSDWGAKLSGEGLNNVLHEGFTDINEVEFYKMYHKDFRSQPYPPHFVLGHSHSPRADACLPGWTGRVNQWMDEGKFHEYTNCATAGRWEQLLWCATILNGIVDLEAWTSSETGQPQPIVFEGNYLGKLVPR